MTSSEYLLKLATWQWFGTLTWDDRHLGSSRSREADVDEYLRERAAHEQLSLSGLPLAIRWERGEQTHRPHCHFLISGFPPSSVTPFEGMTWRALWYKRFGLAQVWPWEIALRAKVARYMGGVEPEDQVRRDGSAQEYETAKFDRADRLVFNGALWAQLQRVTGTTFDVAPTT